MKKKIKDLIKGDKVQSESGKTLTVDSISNSFYKNSKLIAFTNGDWSCELNYNTITLV